MADLDVLMDRLRSRAADPARRTTIRGSRLGRELGSLDHRGLLSVGRSVASDLASVVAANRAGQVDAAAARRADELAEALATPEDPPLRAPATSATIAELEARLGLRLPPALRRFYTEVADGGVGPGEGLLSLAAVERQHRILRSGDPLPHGRVWPADLLPVVSMDPGWDCVDATTGRVIAWDPEGLTERAGMARFERSFEERFPSVEAWLTDWVESRTHDEARDELLADLMSHDAQIRMAREARATIGRLSPAERAAMGLPEVGWERTVWGGLGWDDPEERR